MKPSSPPRKCNWYKLRECIKKHGIMNQEKCNCCWCIASATVVGYLYHIQHDEEKFQLSSQEIVDWIAHRYSKFSKYLEEDRKTDERDCFFGKVTSGLQYICDHGVSFEDAYDPFLARRQDVKGREPPKGPKVYIQDFKRLETQDEVILALLKQPVAGAIDATPEFRCHEGSGIFDQSRATLEERKKQKTEELHAIVILGFDIEKDCYIIRNSWGVKWGYKGYAKVRRHLVRRFSAPVNAFKK